MGFNTPNRNYFTKIKGIGYLIENEKNLSSI
jgi:hypothetical protein